MSEKKRELNYIISAGAPIVYRAETNTDAPICENPNGSGSLPHISVESTRAFSPQGNAKLGRIINFNIDINAIVLNTGL
jgi:hypothetical protein